MSDQGKGLYQAYRGAGTTFLAYRLRKVFVDIKTDEDKALHNDVLREVSEMIAGDEKQFFKMLAEDVLSKASTKGCQLCGSKVKPKQRVKRFLWGIANRILQVGMKKGT